ncbi:MAG: endonuclease/exonuclease/phosphatase family protein [Culicoidibacterales bacterium]
MKSFKIFSQNLHGLGESNPKDCLTRFGAFLASNDYDVVCLQEIVALIDPKPEDDIWDTGEFLLHYLHSAGRTEYQLITAFAHEAWDTCNEFVGILTRLPILDHRVLRVSHTDDSKDFNRRVLMLATLQVGDTPIQFASGHFSWSDSSDPFTQQFTAFDHDVRTTHLPTILAGDCNITSFSPEYIDVINKGWTDLYLVKGSDSDWTIAEEIDGWEGTGFHGRRIDFFFANCPFVVLKANRHFTGEDKAMISDHVGIEIQISH